MGQGVSRDSGGLGFRVLGGTVHAYIYIYVLRSLDTKVR